MRSPTHSITNSLNHVRIDFDTGLLENGLLKNRLLSLTQPKIDL